MIAIIAEKFSVGQDIARVVGATEKKDGYMAGNNYLVTWAFGHLVSLALPGAYGYTRTSEEELPMLPDPFQLVIRQYKSDKGMATDPAATKQLRVIDEVFSKCDSIIVATDAGREGELIFRYIYTYLGYTKPFRRLWISSLTDEAIREGLANLRDGKEYDSLYEAADCRAKADWLVGMNASRALAIVSGTTNNSIGRVQTPTLAMICARFRENRDFIPVDYWQLHITLQKDGDFRQFRYTENIGTKQAADDLYQRITTDMQAVITKVERKRGFQAPPLLYDLTALQKDCNVHLDLSAEKTLAVAQSLYEKKLISYPRTGSRYIPDDVMRQVPELLKQVISMKEFREYGKQADLSTLTTRSVNAKKVTDHHALIITGIRPGTLDEKEQAVYRMIAGRMLEAFSPKCEKETLTVQATADGLDFRSQTTSVVVPGWRGIFNRTEDKEEDEQSTNKGTAEFSESETVPVAGRSLSQKKTTPKPLYTEATLLSAMENPCQREQSRTGSDMPGAAGFGRMQTAGRLVADEEAREAIKELGIGTPATRAAIITTLFKREYVERSGKSLVPTEKGLHLYEAVREMSVADAALTGSWEKTLLQIEQHKLTTETFMRSIIAYTRQVTEEVLSIRLPQSPTGGIPCPRCGKGHIRIRPKVAKCSNEECGLLVFRRFLNKELTDQHFGQLFSSGATRLIKGFKGKKGNAFDASLAFDKEFNVTLVFPAKRGGKSSGKKGAGD